MSDSETDESATGVKQTKEGMAESAAGGSATKKPNDELVASDLATEPKELTEAEKLIDEQADSASAMEESPATEPKAVQGGAKATSSATAATSTEPAEILNLDSENIDLRTLERKDSLGRESVKSLRRVMRWSISTYFDCNPGYLFQFRGIMNILHIIMSLIAIILLGISCRLLSKDDSSPEGFFCRSAETFLFVVACTTFLTGLLFFFCCLLSKKTEVVLYNTSFEVSYFILYAVLYIIAGLCVMLIGHRLDDYSLTKTSYSYRTVYGAGVVGLVNGVLYGASAIVFFITHQYQLSGESSKTEEETI